MSWFCFLEIQFVAGKNNQSANDFFKGHIYIIGVFLNSQHIDKYLYENGISSAKNIL